MTKLTVPGTDLALCPIGLGTARAGLDWDGADANRMFDTYLDFGGNLIDTAHVYSDWVKPEVARSERVVGDWLATEGKRNRVVLMTKGGHPDLTVDRPDNHNSRMTKTEMLIDLDASLAKLRTDYIDVYFYHRDDTNQTAEELVEAMQSFVRAGKIRYYGCSNWSTERMREADAYAKAKGYRGFVANEALLNLAARHMGVLGDDTLETCDDGMQAYHRETPSNLLIPYSGLASGYFHHDPDDERNRASQYDTERNRSVSENVRRITGEYQITVSEALLVWLLARAFPCAPLFGPKKISQLHEAMQTLELPAHIRADIAGELDKLL